MFTLLKTDSETSARRGLMSLAHGKVETPTFMPVGTKGTVKSVHPTELTDPALDCRIILGNTYHLYLRPGTDVLDGFGGLHNFMRWDRPILTDSGGYQVFSLSKLRKITEDGVRFQSHIDGSPLELTPESVLEIQRSIGSDICMILDECPPYPCERDYAANSLALTQRWAERARDWVEKHRPPGQNFFGIVQGGCYPELREKAARDLVSLDFDGYAIGGLSVGEPVPEMMKAADVAAPILPENKPRYAMGLGQPDQLLELISRGIDMFDCVLPTRIARNATAYTLDGTINLKNAKWEKSQLPLAERGKTHPLCEGFSLGYIRHLIKNDEILGLRLLTLHNVTFYLHLMKEARRAIDADSFAVFKADFIRRYRGEKIEP
ncbi:tRNA guanosine(34) transglycosylase Tgt [Verrucomicrobiales bacterium]|jgi:queuine tRNA-ribosyltransferase|nr:tRNA guanosine(34) transglycosylase Tgt [Verrucomicrobiales bacterium]MDB2496590.1 tRNA guanosine(34) transglycosylase Tgt [Verrucomicrobiales bacterium]MDB3940118.1 tRNA guanosine(34) transglycosylase Tgt [Verrucomicrobiales bacterium]